MSEPWGESAICLVCGRVLKQDRLDGFLRYSHSELDMFTDHPVVLAYRDEAPQQVRDRCDLCAEEDPDQITHVLVVDKEISMGNAMFDTEWAMCTHCSVLVIGGQWLDARRRAIAHFERNYGPMTEQMKLDLRLAWRDLREHLVLIYRVPS